MTKLFELQEVYSVLAENFVPWTEQWERRGFRKGQEEEARKLRGSLRRVLLDNLETRFGPVSEEVRRRVEGIESFEELAELTARVGSASDLDSLGLK